MLAAALVLAALSLPPQPPDSAALIAAYREAVANMGPVPAYVSFHESVVSNDADVRMFRDENGVVHTGMILGRANGGREAVQVQYRGEDELAALELNDGTSGVSHSPLYDPTWPGMRAWLRYGLQGAPVGAPQITQQAEAEAARQAEAAASRQALASVRAFTVAFYRLEDRGPAPCPDGAPGRAIHLTSFRDIDSHPLSDVVIDTSAARFCSLRFHLYVPGQVSFSGFIEVHFEMVDSYYLATQGRIEGDVNDVTVDEARRVRIEFTRSAFAFPQAIAETSFQPKVATKNP